jgi:hypothetical protein
MGVVFKCRAIRATLDLSSIMRRRPRYGVTQHPDRKLIGNLQCAGVAARARTKTQRPY